MTDTDVAVVPVEPVRVDLGVIQANRPAELVQVATDAANALAGVIESKKLYATIQGKRFVKCEGWTTLAAMLGTTPHEIAVVEAPDGVFTATVELRRLTDGQPVGRASAECGAADELDRHGKPVWAARPRYARRSMALTRATAKACRLAFSWVMVLAGYEVTPAEEVPPGGFPTAPPAPDLSTIPAPLSRPEPPAPWEQAAPTGPLWKGRPMRDMTSEDLLGLRAWMLKNDERKWRAKIEEIDELLAGREGE